MDDQPVVTCGALGLQSIDLCEPICALIIIFSELQSSLSSPHLLMVTVCSLIELDFMVRRWEFGAAAAAAAV